MMRSFILLALFAWGITGCGEAPQNRPTENNAFDPKPYHLKGKVIADSAFKALSSHLLQAMQEGGPTAALEVCQLKAMPIIDSLSEEYGVQIKRTSPKLRNPANAPDSLEREILTHYSARWESGNRQSLVVPAGKRVRFFSPIGVKPLCIVCHGKPEGQLKERLKKIYPDDAAVGYSEGEFRGIWSIQFSEDYGAI
jgi:hypothetical protein